MNHPARPVAKRRETINPVRVFGNLTTRPIVSASIVPWVFGGVPFVHQVAHEVSVMAGSRSRGPIGTLRNAPAIDAGTLARSSQHPGGVTDGRSYYTESLNPYYRSRGEAAAARERSRFEERRETARQQGSSYLEADIQYLLSRRTETLYKWFTLLKWLREGLRKSGDSTRQKWGFDPAGLARRDQGRGWQGTSPDPPCRHRGHSSCPSHALQLALCLSQRTVRGL